MADDALRARRRREMELLDGQVRPAHAPQHALRQRLGHRRLLLLLLRRRRQSSVRGRCPRQGRRREPAQQEPGGEVDDDVRHPGRDQRGEAAAEVEQPARRTTGRRRRTGAAASRGAPARAAEAGRLPRAATRSRARSRARALCRRACDGRRSWPCACRRRRGRCGARPRAFSSGGTSCRSSAAGRGCSYCSSRTWC